MTTTTLKFGKRTFTLNVGNGFVELVTSNYGKQTFRNEAQALLWLGVMAKHGGARPA